MDSRTAFTFGRRMRGPLAAVRSEIEAALAAEGFGILTEIDVQATLRAKVGAEMAAYVILGACNPTLAQRAIVADPSVGALLPCNVVLRAAGPDTIVEAMDPVAALGLIETPGIRPIADEARTRLERALESLPAAI